MIARSSSIAKVGAAAAVGLVLRVAYVLADRASDPAFSLPLLDGAYYLGWARYLVASGGANPPGAFYLAPLYPHGLALFLAAFGESWTALYVAQEGMAIGAAILLGVTAGRLAGPAAGWACGGLAALYHPLLYLAAKPLGEVPSVALVALALALGPLGARGRREAGRGALLGLAALARPNLLAVPALWAAALIVRRRSSAALLVVGVVALVTPVAIRNLLASGHFVPISSNAGLTLYHGNGPGALGVFTPPRGFSGGVSTQREEATALASLRSRRALDPVEADRFWRSEAVRTRLADPIGSVRLLGSRLLLLLDDHEHGLDYPPALDRNPVRWIAPVPFAAILGLALIGVCLSGWERSGGWAVWGAIVGAAAAPLLFFVSSRYRLPASALLCVPAGVGVAAILARWRAGQLRAAARPIAAGCALALLSFLVPSSRFAAREEPSLLANRAAVLAAAGRLDEAERDLRRTLELDPSSAMARFNLGVVLERKGREEEAEGAYRDALREDPERVEAAGNLAGILIRRGAVPEAVAVLEAALARRPTFAAAWGNLAVAHLAAGNADAAREIAERAASFGVRLRPEILAAIDAAPRAP